ERLRAIRVGEVGHGRREEDRSPARRRRRRSDRQGDDRLGDDHREVATSPSSTREPDFTVFGFAPLRYTVALPAPITSHGPSPVRTSAVCSSIPTSTASRANRSTERSRRCSAARPWYGKIARPGTSPRPTVYAPPRGSTIGSPSTVAPAPDAAITAPRPQAYTIASQNALPFSTERRW